MQLPTHFSIKPLMSQLFLYNYIIFAPISLFLFYPICTMGRATHFSIKLLMFQLFLCNCIILAPISLFLFYPACPMERDIFFYYVLIYFTVQGHTMLSMGYWASDYLLYEELYGKQMQLTFLNWQ